MNLLFLTAPPPIKSGFSTGEKRPPLGVGYLMSVMKGLGHNVFFSDEYLKKTTILKNGFLKNNNIDIVCLYLNTICYSQGILMLNEMQQLRELGEWNGLIFVGGPHTATGLSTIPDYVDRIFIGEAEVSLPKVVNGELSERVVIGEKVDSLDSLPMPAWEEFIHCPYDWGHSWFPEISPIYTMNTSRGCPFDCTFCSVKSIWGKSYRYMSADRVVSDVEHLKNYYGAKGIYFREDHFTLNQKRVVEFCHLLLQKNIKIDWMCETRADDICDHGYQQLMKDAGCKVFYIGVESGSPRILEKIKKGETLDHFIKAFDISKAVGIKTYASFVVGLPFEEQVDLDMTDSLIQRISPDFFSKNIYVGIPGSEIYDHMKASGLYEYEDGYGIIYPLNYKKNIEKYYNNDYYNVYDLNGFDRLKTKSIYFKNKILNFKISNLLRG